MSAEVTVAWTILGLAIIAVLLLDVFVTILSTARAGALTTVWSRAVWRGLLRVHRRPDLGDPGTSMKEYLGGIAANVGDVAERHLAYQVLRYFHSPRAQTAAAPAVLLLSDATFLMGHAPQPLRPGPGLRWSLERSIDEFTAVKRTPAPHVNEEMVAKALRQHL